MYDDGEGIGTVFDIQRFSVHDGPGIRTTVFLKGCPLGCAWCQNPEGLDGRIRVWCFDNLCVRCGRCAAVCPHGAVMPGPVIDQERCQRCGACVDECDRNALAMDGRLITVDALVEKLLDDRVFFSESGGGVTFSGGEPLLQAEFVRAAAARLKAKGIATAVETSLEAEWDAVESWIPAIDFFQTDIKLIDPDRHRAATGRSNETILANFRALARRLPAERLLARLPLIPGYTADAENIRAVARFVREAAPGVRLELLNFNPLAESKYRRMPEKEYSLGGAKAYSETEMETLKKFTEE